MTTTKKAYSIVFDNYEDKEKFRRYLQRNWKKEAWHFAGYYEKTICCLYLTPEDARVIDNMLPRILAD